MEDFVVTVFAVLIEPVVEGVAATGFLFFLTPNTILSAFWRLNTGSKKQGPEDEVFIKN